MRYFFIMQDVSLPCAISYRDFDITGEIGRAHV